MADVVDGPRGASDSEGDFDEGDFPDGECICCGQAFNTPDEEFTVLPTLKT